jgi:hypothetical protein
MKRKVFSTPAMSLTGIAKLASVSLASCFLAGGLLVSTASLMNAQQQASAAPFSSGEMAVRTPDGRKIVVTSIVDPGIQTRQ